MDEQAKALSKYRLEKARQLLQSADMLMNMTKDYNYVVNWCYYAFFNSVRISFLWMHLIFLAKLLTVEMKVITRIFLQYLENRLNSSFAMQKGLWKLWKHI